MESHIHCAINAFEKVLNSDLRSVMLKRKRSHQYWREKRNGVQTTSQNNGSKPIVIIFVNDIASQNNLLMHVFD